MSDVDTDTMSKDSKVGSDSKPKNQKNSSDKQEKGGSCGC